MSLASFQDAFAAALLAPEAGPSGLAAQPGFAVHRNTVLKACIDALQANFPSVARLVGDEWFRAAAAVYARANLPRQPALLDYGENFAAFLARFPPAAELTYLADAALVFAGVTLELEDTRKNYDETRVICYGLLAARLVVVGYTPRGADRHVFSMRKANEREQDRITPLLEV